jgi:hypothetical protein
MRSADALLQLTTEFNPSPARQQLVVGAPSVDGG